MEDPLASDSSWNFRPRNVEIFGQKTTEMEVVSVSQC